MIGNIGQKYFIIGTYNYNETSGLFEGEFILEIGNLFISKITDTNSDQRNCDVFGQFRTATFENDKYMQMQLFKAPEDKKKTAAIYSLEKKLISNCEDITGEYVGKWINAKTSNIRTEGSKIIVQYEKKNNANEVRAYISDNQSNTNNAKIYLESILKNNICNNNYTLPGSLRPDCQEN
jgi:hypothetical protein